MRVEKRKPEGRELVVEGGEKVERRAKEVEGEEPQGMTVDLGYQTSRYQRENPLGRREGGPRTGRAPVPSLVTPEEEWRAGSAG